MNEISQITPVGQAFFQAGRPASFHIYLPRFMTAEFYAKLAVTLRNSSISSGVL
jgi:hypothetical protein